MMKYLLMLAISLNFLQSSAYTQTDTLSSLDEMNKCFEKAPNSQAINNCALKASQYADQLMNRLFQSALQNQSQLQQSHFKTAQDNWLKFRKSYCQGFTGVHLTGLTQSIARNRCMARVTFQHTDHFAEFLADS